MQAGEAKRGFWRWHGQLVDFFVAEPEGGSDESTPTVLLVHGFGAFAEHWRRNIPALAAEGYKVYACTLPGFGPSEKSPQNYTTGLWKAYVRDFVVHVIGKPVVVAGNSIGGVVPANACAGMLRLPPLPCCSLVLSIQSLHLHHSRSYCISLRLFRFWAPRACVQTTPTSSRELC